MKVTSSLSLLPLSTGEGDEERWGRELRAQHSPCTLSPEKHKRGTASESLMDIKSFGLDISRLQTVALFLASSIINVSWLLYIPNLVPITYKSPINSMSSPHSFRMSLHA